MNKLVVFLIVALVGCGARGDGNDIDVEGQRQKRLLFYDEEGNLVKTYRNPLRYDYTQNAEKIQIPTAGKFWNPFYNLLRPHFGTPSTVFMIPVSEAVIRHLYSNPGYQNKLLSIPKKDPVIGLSARCEGKRTQIPADSCHNFLNCWDGWAMEQECPEGLLFSREGYCDYEHNVDCNRDISEDPSPPASPPKPPVLAPVAPPQSDPQAPPPAAAQPPQTPPVAVPQPPVAVPQPPENPPVAPQAPAQVPVPAPAPQCNTEYETWLDAHNCSEFYVCVDRAPVKFQCPANLAYNQEYGVCDYKDRVNCNTNTNQPGNQQAAGTMCSTPDPDAVKMPPPIPGLIVPISPYIANKTPDGKTVITTNAVYNTQSWSSSHMAISRQDAIRQLKLSEFANVSS